MADWLKQAGEKKRGTMFSCQQLQIQRPTSTTWPFKQHLHHGGRWPHRWAPPHRERPWTYTLAVLREIRGHNGRSVVNWNSKDKWNADKSCPLMNFTKEPVPRCGCVLWKPGKVKWIHSVMKILRPPRREEQHLSAFPWLTETQRLKTFTQNIYRLDGFSSPKVHTWISVSRDGETKSLHFHEKKKKRIKQMDEFLVVRLEKNRKHGSETCNPPNQ